MKKVLFYYGFESDNSNYYGELKARSAGKAEERVRRIIEREHDQEVIYDVWTEQREETASA